MTLLKSLLCLLFLLPVLSTATVLTGNVLGPDGSPFTGVLMLTLNQPAALLNVGSCGGPKQIASGAIVRININNGNIPTGTAIFGNDCMSPVGTFYVVKMMDSTGNIVYTTYWQVAGSIEDIGSIIPTTPNALGSYSTITQVTVVPEGTCPVNAMPEQLLTAPGGLYICDPVSLTWRLDAQALVGTFGVNALDFCNIQNVFDESCVNNAFAANLGSTVSVNSAITINNPIVVPPNSELIFLPGQYTLGVNGNIQLSGTSSKLYCSGGADNTVFNVPSTYAVSTGVINVTGGYPNAMIEGCGIAFPQPDVSARASLIQYAAWAINAPGQPYVSIRHVKVSRAWNGINLQGNTGGAVVDDYQVSSFNSGISIDGAADLVKINQMQWWQFGLTTNQLVAFANGSNIGITSGANPNLQLSNSKFGGGIGLDFITTVNGITQAASLSNVQFNDSVYGLVVNSGTVNCSSCSFLMSVATSYAVNQSGGTLSISSSMLLGGGSATNPVIFSTNGYLTVSTSQFNIPSDRQRIYVGGGSTAVITDNSFSQTPNAAYTQPIIYGDNSSRVTATGNSFQDKGSNGGVGIQVVQDSHHQISHNRMVGWQILVPAGYTQLIYADNESVGAGSTAQHVAVLPVTCPAGQYMTTVSASGSIGCTSTQSNCLNILAYGGHNDQSTPNDAAWNAAIAGSIPDQVCIYFPAGHYIFNSVPSWTATLATSTITVKGDGAEISKLWFPSTNGLTFHMINPANSFHIKDLSIDTGGTTFTGVQITNSGAQTGYSASDFTGVTFGGTDGFGANDYWANGIVIDAFSNVSFLNTQFVGSPVGGYKGTGIVFQTSTAVPALDFNLLFMNFQYLNIGIQVNDYTQGITIGHSNFTAVGTGIFVPSGETHGLDELIVSDSQFEATNNAIGINSQFYHVILHDNYFLVNGTGNGVFYNNTGTFSLTDNSCLNIGGLGHGSTCFVIGTYVAGIGYIAGNTIEDFDTGIFLQSTSGHVTVGLQSFANNTTNIVNSAGGLNAIPVSFTGTPTSSFQVFNGTVVHQ